MLKEKRVHFPSGDLQLEGLYADAGGDRGVVISHPNPLMGGSMNNNVVESLVSAFNEKEYSTLRFNFRGVGRSEGTHDQGAGEGDDLASAISFIGSRGVKKVSLAGYSFGAWVTANCLQDGSPADRVVLVSPPVSVYRFPTEAIAGKVSLIVCGEKDPFCIAEDILSFAREIRSKAVFISGMNHFFMGKEDDLVKIVRENLP
jgi:hypothetical protein